MNVDVRPTARNMTASALESADSSGIVEWLAEGQDRRLLRVQRVPLHALHGWSFDPDTGNLRHRTGRFFSVEGIGVTTNVGPTRAWMQPIVDQAEVGILGLIVGYRRGVLHALVQRKVEPGNVNIAQVSPTVQATYSNYTRVHGGVAPPYLEYFFEPSPETVVVDLLQMEQAARYCGKRNRNIVVQVDPDTVPLRPDYRWVTLGGLLSLACHANALNLDTRSVLSCIPFSTIASAGAQSGDDAFPARVLASLTADCDRDHLEAILVWLAGLAGQFVMDVRRVPLRDVAGWRYDGAGITHETSRFFEVLGVTVEAPTREVPRWDQPLVRSRGRGLVGFLCQQREGMLRFLVRGLVEPGDPQVRLGPTVQCIPENHLVMPPFFDAVAHASESHVQVRFVQSEEGGRFYHDERLLVVVELPPDACVDVPPDFRWMTLRDIKEMIRRYGNVNIEARSLVACLPLAR